MPRPKVVPLASKQLEVLKPIVGAISVEMVYPLAASQSPTEMLLHYPPVLHDLAATPLDADVTLRGNHPCGSGILERPGDGLESSHSTRIRAESLSPLTLQFAASEPKGLPALRTNEVVPNDAFWTRTGVVSHCESLPHRSSRLAPPAEVEKA